MHDSQSLLRRVYLLYALSGFVSLAYEVAWFRILVDWFGSTSLTFALVVCGFVGGVGCGALLSRRITDWLTARTGLRDRLRLYGLVELLVAASALLTLAVGDLPGDLWGSFPYRLSDGIWVQATHYQLGQLAVAAACILIPCLFMGVTFPLLCDALRIAGGERLPSTLYAANTLGACSGLLVCQFVFIRWLGHTPTFGWMVGLNLALGLYFLLRGGAPAPASGPVPASGADPAGLPRGAPDRPGAAPWSASALITCSALSGLVAGALEGDMFRRIGFLIVLSPGATMSFISFWAVLGIFLASTLVRSCRWLRLVHIKAAYWVMALYYLAVWRFSDALTYLIGGQPMQGKALHFPVELTQLFVYTGIYVLPPYLLVSLLLPFVCNRLQESGRHLGLAYGLNTLAFCLGMVAFTLVFPQGSIFYSLKLFLVFMALATVALTGLAEHRRIRAWQPAALAALFGVACVITPRTFDRDFFAPSMWPHVLPARGLRSDAAQTTFYVELPDGNRKLFFGRLSMSGTSRRSQEYMRLMAHVPLLAQPHPEKALLICFGVGNTASAIAAHESIRQIDAVDLTTNVFRTAPAFWAFHGNVHLDPRLRMISDDGRNFLNLTGQKYDLITSEPPPPMAGGVYRLYSRQYYEQVLAHLSPKGLMTQWLPEAQMPSAAVELAARTFVEVFPHSLLFRGASRHLILLGGRAPIDWQRLAQRFGDSEPVRSDLLQLGVWKPADLIDRILSDDAQLRRQLGPGRVLSDQHNDLEHLLYDPAQARANLAGR